MKSHLIEKIFHNLQLSLIIQKRPEPVVSVLNCVFCLKVKRAALERQTRSSRLQGKAKGEQGTKRPHMEIQTRSNQPYSCKVCLSA